MAYCSTAKQHDEDIADAKEELLSSVIELVNEMVQEVQESIKMDMGQKLGAMQFANHLKAELRKALSEVSA